MDKKIFLVTFKPYARGYETRGGGELRPAERGWAGWGGRKARRVVAER